MKRISVMVEVREEYDHRSELTYYVFNMTTEAALGAVASAFGLKPGLYEKDGKIMVTHNADGPDVSIERDSSGHAIIKNISGMGRKSQDKEKSE